jgi:methylene-fatty-acyl-phospholipid synthase
LRDPVAALRALFCASKLIQAAVFGAWIAAASATGRTMFVPTSDPLALVVGAVLIAAGQSLNLAVFHRPGAVGVFYGSRFGRSVPWVHGFPFSVLTHPQYVGTVATIWGLFLVTRFPHPDWIALPLLETIYYAIGARLERTPTGRMPSKLHAGGRGEASDQAPIGSGLRPSA